MLKKSEFAVFGGGCFWCTEAVFRLLKGVSSVVPGYAGGTKPKPSYEEVCSGTTGHAEVITIEFDPSVISYKTLLDVFFASHDPTTRNRQGNDVGEQYRSVILSHSAAQETLARAYIGELNAAQTFGRPVVTEVKPLGQFFAAEGYHHRYFENNAEQPYCQVVITPKVAKIRERFSHLVRPTEVGG